MGERTGIEWCTATWNPWHGCTKVSPGCARCYMYREKKQYGQDPSRVVRSKTKFEDPHRWKTPQWIFTCSWSDFFHETADPWRGAAWEIIRQTPHHTYLILTKRPERMAGRLPWPAGGGWPHVWLGVSIESAAYEHRVEQLVDTCAAHRFVSAEPLLGPVSLGPWLGLGGIEWVIAGGESGPKARPMNLTWARILRTRVTRTHRCERCRCTEARACEGGCAWLPRFLRVGRFVCDRCGDQVPPPRRPRSRKRTAGRP